MAQLSWVHFCSASQVLSWHKFREIAVCNTSCDITRFLWYFLWVQIHVYGEQMKQFKFTRKEINLEAKRAIRVTIINPAVRLHSADSASETEVS